MITEQQLRFVQRHIENVPYFNALGIRFLGRDADWIELEMPYSEMQIAYPDTGVIASGAIYALMDSTAGLAVMMGLAQIQPIATIDMRLDYLHPPIPHQPVIGRAHCYKYTRSVAFVRGVAHQGDSDHPVANMVGTFMLSGAA